MSTVTGEKLRALADDREISKRRLSLARILIAILILIQLGNLFSPPGGLARLLGRLTGLIIVTYVFYWIALRLLSSSTTSDAEADETPS